MLMKAGSMAEKCRLNQLIELYRSEPFCLYILEIKIDDERSDMSSFCKWYIISIKLSVKLLIGVVGYVESKSGIIFAV